MMKFPKLFLLLALTVISCSKAYSQANATLNILTLNGGVVTVGNTVDLQVTIGNTGPVSSIGVNKVRAQISIPSAIATALGNAQQTGLPAGWTILSNTGSVITICNGSDVIPVGAQRQVFIKIQGTAVGGPSTIAGALSFGPGTGVCTGLGTLPGDITSDNTSTSTIQVNAATPCVIGVTASAGGITCNGGNTTLTATATGATGAVQYSLNGGAFQPGNTFTVNAAGSPYIVTVREVANPSCTASSSPVTVTEPAPVPAPSVSVVQPTCTIATGTITITSSTSGFTFSLDGAAYAAYPAGGYIVASGAHTLTAQNSSGCISVITSITIDAQPSTPGAPTVSVVQPTCNVATGTITITSATSGLTFSLDGAAYAAYPAGGYTVAGGAHTLTAQNSAGCVSPVTNITVDAQPSTPAAPTVSVVQPTCAVATGTITVTSATSGLSFSLDGAAYATYPVGGYTVASGAHTLTAQNSAGCISPVTNITVNVQPSTPAAPTVTVVHPTCTVATGTITITSSTSGLTFSLDGGAYAAYPVGGYTVASGAHTLTAQNTSGCISPVTNSTINAQPPTPAAPLIGTVIQPTCTVSTGSVTLTNLPAGDWVINPGGISGNTSSVVISNLSPGTYSFTVTNSVGCTSVLSAEVTINLVIGAPLAPTVSIIHPDCNTSTGTITITSTTSGLTFSLDGGAYAVYPSGGYIVAAGAHTLSAQNSSGCISPVTNITVNPQPPTPAAPAVTIVHPTCTVATGTITVTSSVSGLLFSLDGGPFTAYPSGGYTVSAGLHTLIVQNTAGCNSAAASITINAQPPTPAAPGIGTIVQPTCFVLTGSVELTGLPSGNWIITGNPGAFTTNGNTPVTTISGLVPDTYTFTVTNSFGCISAASANVVISVVAGTPAAPTVSVVQPTCTVATGTIIVTSTTSGLTFSLDGAAYASYPAGGYTVASGPHTLTAQNTAGCVSPVTNITVNAQPPTPVAPTVSVVHPTCTVATGTITVTSTTSGLTFSLDGTAYAAYPASGYTVASGAHTLTVQNAAGCISPVTNITVNAQPSTPAAPTVSVVQPTCTVATGTITIASSTSGLTFSLDGGAYSAYPAGGYTVASGAHTLTAQNITGCISPVTVITVNVQPSTPAAPAVNVVQPSCTVATGTITITSSTSGLTFSLDGGAYAAYPPGGYIVASGAHTLTAQNSAGCVSAITSVAIIPQLTLPAVTLSAGAISCFGGSTTLTAGTTGGVGPFEYSINGGAFQASENFTVGAGTYTVTVRNTNLCTALSAPLTIQQPTAISVTASVGAINCNGGTTTITVNASGGTSPFQYRLNGGTFQSANTFTVAAGNYTVSVRDANNCNSSTISVTVTQPAVLNATVTASRITTCGGKSTVTLTATGGTLPYTGTGTFTRGPGTWNFTVTDARGCTITREVVIDPPGCMNLLVYPNPAVDILKVEHSPALGGSVINIFSINGTLVLSQPVTAGSFLATFNIQRLSKGTYTVVFISGNEKREAKFEKLK